jgi:hypothetical protein
VAAKAAKGSQSGCSKSLPVHRASSPVFAKRGAQLTSIAFVYARDAVARTALSRLRDPKQQRCFETHYLKQVRASTPSARLRRVTIRTPRHAATAFAFVLSYTSGGKHLSTHFELAAFRRGRIVCELIASAPSRAPSAKLVQRVTAKLAARAASG